MKRLRAQIARLGPVSEPVLVLGPTGSGKEIAARLLHEASGVAAPSLRSTARFSVATPTGSRPAFRPCRGGLHRGEGHPARRVLHGGRRHAVPRRGRRTPLPVQTQLLRVLEERLVTPGHHESHTVDVRVIAATNQDLPAMVRAGTFRRDLFHRLNVLFLRVPSLKERLEDLKSIARGELYELKNKGYGLEITKADWDAIHAYDWPGNIRQFINILRRAAYMKQSVRETLAEEIALFHAGNSRAWTPPACASSGPPTPPSALG